MLSAYRPLYLKEKIQVFQAYWKNPLERNNGINVLAIAWILMVEFVSFEGGRWWRWIGAKISPKPEKLIKTPAIQFRYSSRASLSSSPQNHLAQKP